MPKCLKILSCYGMLQTPFYMRKHCFFCCFSYLFILFSVCWTCEAIWLHLHQQCEAPGSHRETSLTGIRWRYVTLSRIAELSWLSTSFVWVLRHQMGAQYSATEKHRARVAVPNNTGTSSPCWASQLIDEFVSGPNFCYRWLLCIWAKCQFRCMKCP